MIKLENHSNYELEDLDPLNQHAKPLPPLPPLSTHPNPLGLNNPLYPFVQPQLHTTRLSSHKIPENDNDLLRKYGLDKFPVLNETNERTNSSTIDGTTSRLSNPKTEWIQFD